MKPEQRKFVITRTSFVNIVFLDGIQIVLLKPNRQEPTQSTDQTLPGNEELYKAYSALNI